MRRIIRRLLGFGVGTSGADVGANGKLPNPAWFDAEWYVYRYSDVASFPESPLLHFYRHGAKELRQPSPNLDLTKIVDRHPELFDASVDDLFEAVDRFVAATPELCQAQDETSFKYLVEINSLFDEAWYIARNRDVLLGGDSPLNHFIRHGASENRDPGPAFDSDFYRSKYPEYVEESRTAIEHFVRIGLGRGYVGAGPPIYDRWIETFDTLTEVDIERFRSDGRSLKLSAVAFHVVDDDAAALLGRILDGWQEQVGCACRPFFLRGAGMADEAWSSCRAQVEARPNFAVFDPGRDTLPEAAQDIVMFVAGPTIMRPHAAALFAETLLRSEADAAYADHDHIDADGRRATPAFKPAMSPEFMRACAYAGHVVAARLPATNGSNVHAILTEAMHAGEIERVWADWLLTVPPHRVTQIPFILSHACQHQPTGSAVEPSADRARPASKASVDADHDLPSLTIIIPTRDRVELLRACIQSIWFDADYPSDRRQLIVVDNGSKEPATADYLSELVTEPYVTVVPHPGSFNFSVLCNDGASHALGDIIVFLNNDTTALKPDWLQPLVALARQRDIGVVGAHLLYPDAATQHGGVVLGIQGVGAHRLKAGELGPAGSMHVTRELVAVTGACLAIRRDLFHDLGGFDPVLRIAFNDVKLCASAHQAGYRNVYVGRPLMYHHESKSRGLDDTVGKKRRSTREAIHVREQFGHLFRSDPTYSPNLSLQSVDKLAMPPRAVRPWRRTRAGEPRRVLLLCYQHGQGHGVATVVDQQAQFLRSRGWEVTVGGPKRSRDLPYEGCRRISLWTADAAAAFAIAEGIDCIVAHSPPFFSITRFLGDQPFVYFTDHGEPPPQLFPDKEAREDVDWEKRFCASLAKRVFAISRTIQSTQYRSDAVLIRNGNSHLSSWSDASAARRKELRKKLGFEDAYVVLSVCRFGPGERVYKGVNRYGEVASDLPYAYPALQGKIRFVLAGRGDEDDVAAAEAMGLEVHANVSDAELIEFYVASDLYMSFSEWEGYNLGIGQALAMGLDVIASDISAHREFGIEVLNDVPGICASVARRYARWFPEVDARTSVVQEWAQSLRVMASIMENDLDAAAP